MNGKKWGGELWIGSFWKLKSVKRKTFAIAVLHTYIFGMHKDTTTGEKFVTIDV